MGQPIRGMTRPLPVKASIIPAVIPPEMVTLDANFNASIHNRFDVEVIDVRTGKIKQRAQAENVICSQLWTKLFAPATYFNYIHYGTGSGTPASTDTSLFTFLGYGTPSISDDVYAYDGVNSIYSVRRKIQLSETTAVGSTLTEVGIGYSTTSATLCTHAMLKDANGNQISIAKTNTDIISVYATVFVHFAGSFGAFFGASSGSALLGWAIGMQALNTQVNVVGANASEFSPGNTMAYSAASKTVTNTITRIPVNSGNYSGLIAVRDGYGTYLRVDPAWYSGSAITGEAIGTGDGAKTDFATAFGFVKSGATIYVNGVATSATVDTDKPTYITNLAPILLPVDSSGKIVGTSYSTGTVGPSSVASKTVILYNPYFESLGLTYWSGGNCNFYYSNDLTNWTLAGNASVDTTAHKNSKYWKVENTDYSSSRNYTITGDYSGKNIHFPTPPASGAVITADYSTALIAKDVNHVFDLTVTIQLGEYTA